MDNLLNLLRQQVTKAAAHENFIHHNWFVKYHLEVVEKIALELLAKHPEADKQIVIAMVWMHDYGKIIDFANQYQTTLNLGSQFMQQLGFTEPFTQKVLDYIKIMDNKLNEDLHLSPIEVQIVSSSDAASHFWGPFMSLWWYENATKPYTELMADNLKKAKKDWERKMVLPEVQEAFAKRYHYILELNGVMPDKFLD